MIPICQSPVLVLLIISDSSHRISATPTMDSAVSACSQGPVIGTASSTHYRTSSVAEGLELHPYWPSVQAKGLANPPPYTDGPSRVILANDGTRDCLALLLTPDLVAALNQITHDIQKLEEKVEALERIEAEIVDLSRKADTVKETVRNPRYQDQAEEMQLAVEILQLKRQEAHERKTQVNIESALSKSSLKVSRSQSQAIFEEALLQACLLDPPEPSSPPVPRDVAADDSSAGDHSDAASTYEGVECTPDQQLLRQARMDVLGSYETLRTHRARFDDRHADYKQKLAEFRRSGVGFADARTEFDRGHIRHVRDLTRDLVSAERGYRTAKAKARALELAAKPRGFDSGFGCLADGGDRWGGSDDGSTGTGVDREGIEAWMGGVLPGDGVEGLEEKERFDLDGWDAKPVEMRDSVSVMDREEYVDEINEWEEHCRSLRERERR